ncbi:MAG: hypothetical protein OH319_01065 [Candidatus Parvarchaeota archaeon]|nr:hypothetical protein [Candidatus Jingweiarchaeum tengchongense]MCW1299846.1 hypothetical protein [Candidatus Jingweiarchaeum tengchongense]MCW1305212.1 hypothetical protein [Candidatus Jingweiarchaeum tengchongense]MCW1310680.1 hypothetical protein [Candidatus Jingweiarchaeum tengchongense]
MRKRINRNIKHYKMLNNKKISFIFDGSAPSFVCFFHIFNLLGSRKDTSFTLLSTKKALKVAKEISKKYGVMVKEIKNLKLRKTKETIVLNDCLEDTCEKLIIAFAEKKLSLINEIKPRNGNLVRPLFNIPIKEIETLARLKNYNFLKYQQKNIYLNKINKVEEMRPGAKFSLVNLFESLF